MIIACTASLSGHIVFAQDSLQVEPVRYTEFSECLQNLFVASDILFQKEGAEQEIIVLKENRFSCEISSPITRRVAVKYLEWGDNIYNEKEKKRDINKKELFREGLGWAKLALREDTLDYLNFEVLSMSYAALISVSGLRTKARLADSVRVYAEESIRLNPKNDRAYHILGRWHYEVSKLGWFTKFLAKVIFRESQDGSFEKATEYFFKAIELDNIAVHRYWLGLAYLEKGEKEEALKQFEILQDLPNVQHNDEYFKQKAKELIEKHS